MNENHSKNLPKRDLLVAIFQLRQNNHRVTQLRLATTLGVSIGTVGSTAQELERLGLITPHGAQLALTMRGLVVATTLRDTSRMRMHNAA